MNWKLISNIFVFLVFGQLAFSQNLGNSPYSQNGIGDLSPDGLSRNIEMGQTGVASPSSYFINLANPSLLPINKFTVMDFGVIGQIKALRTSSASDNSSGGNFNHLVMAVPLIKERWSMALGLRRFSNVNYQVSGTDLINNDTRSYNFNYKGNGGTNEVFIANGIKLTNKIYTGFTTSYYFGAIKEDYSAQIVGDNFKSTYYNRTNHGELNFKPGFFFKSEVKKLNKNHILKISKTIIDSLGVSKTITKDSTYTTSKIVFSSKDTANFKGTGLFYSIGGVADFSHTGNSTEFESVQRRTATDGLISEDTLKNNVPINYSLPLGYKVGINLERTYVWALTADFSYKNWSNYKNSANAATLANSYGIGIGGERFVKLKLLKSEKLVIVRGGFNYQKTPYIFDNQQVEDISFSTGISFLLPKSKEEVELNPKFINLTVVVGQRGNLDLIREQYIRFNFGVTVNDRWFKRYKVD